MKQIKIHNDITVLWDIVDPKKQPYDLTGKRLTLMLHTGRYTHIEIDDFTIVGNRVCFVFEGKKQRHLGTYDIELIENAGRDGERSVDECNVFKLVRHTNQTGGEDSCAHIHTETIALSSVLNAGIKGDAGKSAYEVAVDNGFDGTEEEWLASLQGPAGSDADVTAQNIESALGYKPVSQTDVENIIDSTLFGTIDGMTMLEAAISDGQAWVDTGLQGAGTMRIVAVCGGVPAGKISASVVAHVSSISRIGFMVFNTSSHKIAYFWPGVPYTELTVNSHIDLNKEYTVVQDADGISVQQGAYTSSARYSGTNDIVSANIHLLHSENPNHSAYNYGTIYRCTITSGDDTLLDVVPARRESDGKVGCYDAVNKTLYLSAGSGEFAAGKETDGVVGGKEDKENKVTQITEHSTDIEYPSAKAVYDYVGDAIGDIETLLSAI